MEHYLPWAAVEYCRACFPFCTFAYAADGLRPTEHCRVVFPVHLAADLHRTGGVVCAPGIHPAIGETEHCDPTSLKKRVESFASKCITIDIIPDGKGSCEMVLVQNGKDIAAELQEFPRGIVSESEKGWQQRFDLMATAWETNFEILIELTINRNGKKAASTVECQMTIRKPVSTVFQPSIDPVVTTKFWFTKSSGRLEVDKNHLKTACESRSSEEEGNLLNNSQDSNFDEMKIIIRQKRKHDELPTI